jgi:endonuclease YncB( thermonuclease family)
MRRFIFIILISIGSLQIIKASDLISGKVSKILDGDTLIVRDELQQRKQHKIRLIGIDAPEQNQPYWEQSKQHLSGLVLDKRIMAICTKVDEEEVWLCKVRVDGKDINAEQVKAGMAWYHRMQEDDLFVGDKTFYAKFEQEARQSKKGLWSQDNPIAPWEYKQKGKGTRPRKVASINLYFIQVKK